MANDWKEGTMRRYVIDRIDDAADEQLEQRIEAANDEDALSVARAVVAENGWDAAEVWDTDADLFVGEVSR